MVWPLACQLDNCLLHFYFSGDWLFQTSGQLLISNMATSSTTNYI